MAVALLLVLALLTVGTPAPSSGVSGSTGVPFSSARHSGGSVIPSAGGNWELLDAFGFDLANMTTEALDLSNLSANCTVTSLSGPLPGSLTIPRFTGDLSSGDAAFWELGYLQPSTLSEIAVAVTDGTVALALEISGPHCLPTNASGVAPIPPTVVDSTVAASATASAGAAAFLAAHPEGVSLEMGLVPSTLGGPGEPGYGYPAWWFQYSTCTAFIGIINGTGPPGETFYAVVNATTGAVAPGSVTTGACGGSGAPPEAIGSVLQFGFPTLNRGGAGGTLESQGCTGGDYCFSLPVSLATNNVTPSDFEEELMVQNSSGDTPYTAVGFAIVNSQGQVVVYSYGTVEIGWSDGVGTAETPITSTMTFWLDAGPQSPPSTNLFVAFTGIGAYSGSEESVGLG